MPAAVLFLSCFALRPAEGRPEDMAVRSHAQHGMPCFRYRHFPTKMRLGSRFGMVTMIERQEAAKMESESVTVELVAQHVIHVWASPVLDVCSVVAGHTPSAEVCGPLRCADMVLCPVERGGAAGPTPAAC